MQIELRDYQERAKQEARRLIHEGKKAVLIVAPTGSGKTVISASLMESAVKKGNSVNFVVDRLSLIDQTSDVMEKYGIAHGVIQASHARWQPWQKAQVCSIQTLSKRDWPESKLDIFDEAHVLHQEHKDRLASTDGIVVGLTATPFTKGLGKYFDGFVNVTTTRQLIHDGWLVPYRIFSCAEPDMSDVPVSNTGEWVTSKASSKALEVVGDVVAEYIKHGEGRKFICSAVDTAHVLELQRQFLAAGINAATYTYRDKQEDRAEVVNEFRLSNSSIRGLITVTAASRGFDVPDVSCIIMARPLRKSLAEHIQLFGRGLRISPSTGKTDCLVLDHSGNAARFYRECEDFFDHGITELDDGTPKPKEKPQEKPEKEPMKCPSCGHLHDPRPFCPACGHQYPKKEAISHVPGSLKELVAGGYHDELNRGLWPMIVGYTLSRNGDDLVRAKSRALGLYKSITGKFPDRNFDISIAAEPSPEILRKIKSVQIAYAYSKKKAA